MNRRFVLAAFAALPLLVPGRSASAQSPRAGVAASSGQDERSSDDRERKRKRAEVGGLALGGGLGLALASRADNVTQQEYCLGACNALRGNGPKPLVFGYTNGAPSMFAEGSNGQGEAKRAGAFALLSALGSVTEDATDMLPGSKKPLASDGRPGNETAAENRSKHLDRTTSTESGATDDGEIPSAFVAASDEVGTSLGCVTGCFTGPGMFEGTEGTSGTLPLFGAPNSNTLSLTAADVGTIVNPEPGTVALTLAGLLALGGVARRKRSRA